MGNGETVKVGFISRVDFKSEGFRQGLLEAMKEAFEKEDICFYLLLGGLVSSRALKNELVSKKSKEERDAFASEIAEELAEIWPRIERKNGNLAKMYIVTSPAYDGVIGEEVAQKLSKLRRADIRVWHSGDDRFSIKGTDKILWGVTPEKAVWMRGDFYSTPIQRVLKDIRKRSSQKLPTLYAIGGFASNVNKPQGEEVRPYLSVPALHKIREITTSENQIGVKWVDFSEGKDGNYKVYSCSFRDLLSNERRFIALPENVSRVGRKIIKEIESRGGLTSGQLADLIEISRTKIEEEIQSFPKKSRYWPGVICDEFSKKYDFNLEWVQKNLRYIFPKKEKEKIKEDKIIAFGCLHAGCIHTDYNFFLNELPQQILRENVRTLIGAGDFIEGLKHNLILRGEVYGSADYTRQETMAGHLVAAVMLKVFKERFEEKFSSLKWSRRKISSRDIRGLIIESLISFYYIAGNHCLWTQDLGFRALNTFTNVLHATVIHGIRNILKENDCLLVDIEEIVKKRIIQSNKFILDSGLTVEIFHPHMSRTKTESIRAQEALAKSDANIVIVANFHVAIHVQEYSAELGERQNLTVGTIKHKSDFEDNKLKIVDFGVGYLGLKSIDGRIIASENAFWGKSSGESLDNNDIFKRLYRKIGLDVSWI